MNKNETLTLLDGQFTAEEANEVLMSIYRAKIHFHEMKNFSSQERFGCDCKVAMERIPDLKKSMLSIQELMSQAGMAKKRVVISSQVKLEFVDVEP